MKLIISYKKFFLIFCLLLSNTVLGKNKQYIQNLDKSNVPDNVIFFDENEKQYSLDQFEGKTILLVFWAKWCASCVKEMPDLDMLQKDFRKLPFEVIPISQDSQGVQAISEHYKSYQIRYLPIYYDYKNQLFKALEVVGLPTSILIDPDGRKLVSFVGNINWHDEEVRAIILSHIPGNNPEPKNSYRAQSLNQPPKPLPIIEVKEEKKPDVSASEAQDPAIDKQQGKENEK